MACDIVRDQDGADFFGFKARSLLIDRADVGTLLGAEHGKINRTRNMIFLKFRWRAHIDNFVKLVELCYGSERCHGWLIQIKEAILALCHGRTLIQYDPHPDE